MPTNPLIVPLIIIFFSFFFWLLFHQYKGISTLKPFTDQEKVILRRQAISLMVVYPFVLIGMLLFWFGLTKLAYAVPLAVGTPVLVYIALTSIVHQVSILRFKGQQEPSKGRKAVFVGIFMFAFQLVVIGIFLFYW